MVHEKGTTGWWNGEASSGTGWFPESYVQKMVCFPFSLSFLSFSLRLTLISSPFLSLVCSCCDCVACLCECRRLFLLGGRRSRMTKAGPTTSTPRPTRPRGRSLEEPHQVASRPVFRAPPSSTLPPRFVASFSFSFFSLFSFCSQLLSLSFSGPANPCGRKGKDFLKGRQWPHQFH